MSWLRLVQVPYDLGVRERRMGRGPFHLVKNGALDSVAERMDHIESVVAEYQGEFSTEIETTFELQREISREVHAALERGAFPLVLAGNCSSTVGAVAGVGNPELGLLWFDGHGDFNTPETTTTGFVDGMPV